MINSSELYKTLTLGGIEFFAGVPDSILRGFSEFLSENLDQSKHIIAANEGNATALAIGHFLGTGQPGAVYMQNSGLGNAINPLLSIADPLIYAIPLLLLVGWRGQPGAPLDEPQHAKQGVVTLQLLDAMDLRYQILTPSTPDPMKLVESTVADMIVAQAPTALVFGNGSFSTYDKKDDEVSVKKINREEAINSLLDSLEPSSIVVATTGFTSRELFSLRDQRREQHTTDFLTIGSMGHCCQIALKLALSFPRRSIYCFDGDGSALMHLGGLALIGHLLPQNFTHIIFNNGVHDSVGGQPIAAPNIDFSALALSLGYKFAACVSELTDIVTTMYDLKHQPKPALISIQTQPGARSDLGRPAIKPMAARDQFMLALETNA